MEIADNILQQRLHNVYFIWGAGKTTVANALGEQYGCYVYHTDYERSRHFQSADPQFQRAMCREVPDYWALEPEDARQWEKDIVREFTPMVLMDLVALSAQHQQVICEGDIDIDLVMPVVSHAVTLFNCGEAYDFFDRPEQKQMLDDILSRRDLTDEEKAQRIENARKIVVGTQTDMPRETAAYGVKQINWNRQIPVDETVKNVAEYFRLSAPKHPL